MTQARTAVAAATSGDKRVGSALSQPLLVKAAQVVLPNAARPAPSLAAVLLTNGLVGLVLGGCNYGTLMGLLSQKDEIAALVPLEVCLLFPGLLMLLAPFLVVAAVKYRDQDGQTWYESYGGTPAVRVLWTILYAINISFSAYILFIVVEGICTLCPIYTVPTLRLERLLAHGWLLHITTGLAPMLLAPMQFLKRLRGLYGYRIHRWLGRIVFAATVVNQCSALLLLGVGAFKENKTSAFWVYYASLGFLFAATAVCATKGYYYARKKDGARHGAWMHRMMALWCAIPISRIVFAPLLIKAGQDAAMALGLWVAVLGGLVGVEVFLRASGRFVPAPAQALPQQPGPAQEAVSNSGGGTPELPDETRALTQLLDEVPIAKQVTSESSTSAASTASGADWESQQCDEVASRQSTGGFSADRCCCSSMAEGETREV